MSKFRTKISDSLFSYKFQHEQPVLCIGSCFAEHIGQRLQQFKFTSLLNPSGILYNPYSIAKTIHQLIDQRKFDEADIFQLNGQWHSFDHHSQFSNQNQAYMLQSLNDQINHGHQFLKKAKHLIITFGTSNVFVFKENQNIVANCHKVPNHNFERKTLFIEEITNQLDPLFKKLKSNNADLEILLTVSPVRHIRDGLIENQRSKARLLLSCEQLVEANDFVHYFPSYEIMMDDLRDYRFYKKDMIHPNEIGIDYIWEFFENCFFNQVTKDLNSKIRTIITATQHKPFHQASNEHQAFIKKYLSSIEKMKEQYRYLDFTPEQSILNQQLIHDQ